MTYYRKALKHLTGTKMLILFIIIVALMTGLLAFMIKIPDKSHQGPLPPLTAKEQQMQHNLKQHVNQLAGKIGERNIWHYNNLIKAEEYISRQFKQMGYRVNKQSFTVNNHKVSNIIAEKKGASEPKNILVIGAHYDSVRGSPGADDNASGVAALLEIAQHFHAEKPEKTIRFIAFVNEEPPFFRTSNMGSFVYAKQAQKKLENISTMISLESLGYYSNAKNSQKYPWFLGLLYPNTANFIGFVSSFNDRPVLHKSILAFRQTTKFPSEGIAAPSFIPGVSWSDHWAFWYFDYPAIMITDTALYRNPYYHTAQDMPNTLNYDYLARVTHGLIHVIKNLSYSSN